MFIVNNKADNDERKDLNGKKWEEYLKMLCWGIHTDKECADLFADSVHHLYECADQLVSRLHAFQVQARRERLNDFADALAADVSYDTVADALSETLRATFGALDNVERYASSTAQFGKMNLFAFSDGRLDDPGYQRWEVCEGCFTSKMYGNFTTVDAFRSHCAECTSKLEVDSWNQGLDA